jgi:nicotinamidase-related amidase
MGVPVGCGAQKIESELKMAEPMNAQRPLIVGKPALIMVDFQGGGEYIPGQEGGVPSMGGLEERHQRWARGRTLVTAARAAQVPVIFIQEVHRPDMVDFGRELDGAEDVHCVEGLKTTEIAAEAVDFRPGDYHIPKRRYSAFYGTDFEILLKGLKVQTLILTGGLTDVCVHYTFVDGHQGDYYCRVVEDCVGGSSRAAHDASLNAMEYLQAGARRTTAEILAAFGALKPSLAA